MTEKLRPGVRQFVIAPIAKSVPILMEQLDARKVDESAPAPEVLDFPNDRRVALPHAKNRADRIPSPAFADAEAGDRRMIVALADNEAKKAAVVHIGGREERPSAR